TFSVLSGGTAPLVYRWFKDGNALTNGGTLFGATNSTLTISNVQTADAAGYTVVITNASGSITSAPSAILTVLTPPVITAQPASTTNNAGTTATFTVAANGGALSYRWIKDATNILTDGGDITGSTTATLSISNVLESDEGSYTVVITNITG